MAAAEYSVAGGPDTEGDGRDGLCSRFYGWWVVDEEQEMK